MDVVFCKFYQSTEMCNCSECFQFISLHVMMLCTEVEAGAGATAVVRTVAEAQFVGLGEIQMSMEETITEPEFQLHCVKTLLLVNAGEALIAIFRIRVVKVMRTVGKVDIGKLELQIISPHMTRGSIP